MVDEGNAQPAAPAEGVDPFAAGPIDKPTGASGTMRIYDNGVNAIEFLILCSDPATNVGGFTWSGVVNGVGVGGTVALPAGFGQRSLGSWVVTTQQTVTFHMNATGTLGLGGPTDHSALIVRTTVPGAPPAAVIQSVGVTSVAFTIYPPASNGGSPVLDYQLQISTNPAWPANGAGLVAQWSSPSSAQTSPVALTPGTGHYVRYRARNAVGFGGWSPTTPFTTLTGGRRWNGTAWVNVRGRRWNGTSWVNVRGRRWNDTAWKDVR